MTRFFQMQATWWNRLEVDASNLVEQAWCKCKQPDGTGLKLIQATWWNRLDVKMPSFCLFMNLFLHWEHLNFLSLSCSRWLNSAALTNLFSQFKQLNVFVWTFVLHSIFRSDPNYDNKNDKVFPNASNLMEQAWSWYKQPGGTSDENESNLVEQAWQLDTHFVP